MRTLENQLLDLERQYWQAIKDRDVDAALQLTDDPCIVAGAQGVNVLRRAQLAKMMSEAPYTLEEFRIDENAEVRMIADDVGVLAYNVRERLTVEGKPVTIDAAESSTWVRRNGHWLCALHTEAIAGDPFGRDRKSR